MALTWLSIRVEMLGGRGDELWPPPGRVFALGPSHTFADLARAIDDAFARWDRAHLCEFTLSDGLVVTDEETGSELAEAPVGPLGPEPLILRRAKVVSHVRPGDEFRYVFDLGDNWTHSCVVAPEKVDPVEVLGIKPKVPLPYWGWGSIPDQYGRSWDDDAGEGPVPRRPGGPHPMLFGGWPETGPGEPVDLRELRGAIARKDVEAILAAVQGRDIDDVLQHVGQAAQVVLASDRVRGEPLAVSLANRLSFRAAPGDDVLAEDLVADLRGIPQATRTIPVDLSELADALEGDQTEPGGYLDLSTGEVLPWFLTDPAETGEDAYVDVEEEPDRWLSLERLGSRKGWEDMADFARDERDGQVRDRLESAIHGKGAFRRFRDEVERHGVVERWLRYSSDHSMGRAREYLAGEGYRVSLK